MCGVGRGRLERVEKGGGGVGREKKCYTALLGKGQPTCAGVLTVLSHPAMRRRVRG